jgi:uncharacterized protein YbjT (DUF2867 family)
MQIILTGSLGNIGKPLTSFLVQNGHSVSVITRNSDRKTEIEALGATASIGSIDDVDFLMKTFKDADCVYLMEAVDAKLRFDPNFDIIEAYKKIAINYKKAVEQSGVKNIIHLSSIAAHTTENNGVLAMHYYAEQILNQLPADVNIKFMRPVGFYSNFLRSLESIRKQGAIISNYGGDKKEPWVSPFDIASKITDEMESPFDGRSIHYIASEEISPNEIAATLGKAIGNPDLKWIAISNEEYLKGMISMGMNEQIAKGFVDMQIAQSTGILYEDYYKNEPVLGKTKFVDFAEEFAKIYRQ